MLDVTNSWTSRLWTEVEQTYAQILEHEFLAGLTDGSLDEARFTYYLAQDAHYLREFARALAATGAKAPSHVETAVWSTHAAATARVEMALHEVLLPQLGVDSADLIRVPMSPTTTAYTSYLLSVTLGGSYAEAIAAVLPCFWVYQRVGDALIAQGSPDQRFQRWIDTYGGDEFAASVAEVLALADGVGASIAVADETRARQHFVTATKYEWMFWDAAWRLESWPV